MLFSTISAFINHIRDFIGPLFEQGGYEDFPIWQGTDRSSAFKTSVCLSVCSPATGHSFWPRNLIFLHSIHWEMRKKKRNFLFFEILIFGPSRALFRLFSSIFFFTLYNSSVRATSHTDGLTNFNFGTESLYDTIMWHF